jgi:predicted AlkP superfamily phosphohydrolase/phosphomutase
MLRSVLPPAAMPRVLVIGLDCVPPVLAFERYRELMPNLHGLMARGTFGPLRSTLPPITVPAWASMLSGWDPGELGLYGFRNRSAGSHTLHLVSSADLKLPMVWDRLGERGLQVCVLFVPPSYPPRAVNGQLVSCFLTPDAASPHTHPPELASELEARFGAYRPDVEDYRSDELPRLLAEVYALSEQRFGIAEHLLWTRRPDFTALVDIGPDRFHHAFWSHIDPSDPKHVPGNPFALEGQRYYAFLDRQIGRLLRAAGEDCAVMVVSDHGARALRGAICVNEWLIEHGYLVLRRYPDRVTPFAQLEIDWNRTRAWGEGGYYARISLNVRGRDAQGCVEPSDVEHLRADLARGLGALRGPSGETLAHRVVTPQAVYPRIEGLPPDLMVFFDDLGYRSLGSVGHRSLYSAHNDTGPDACNHDWDGIFVLSGPGVSARGPRAGLRNCDVAPTILSLMHLAAPELSGSDLSGRSAAPLSRGS